MTDIETRARAAAVAIARHIYLVDDDNNPIADEADIAPIEAIILKHVHPASVTEQRVANLVEGLEMIRDIKPGFSAKSIASSTLREDDRLIKYGEPSDHPSVTEAIFLDREAVRQAELRQPNAYYFGPYRSYQEGRDVDSLLKFPFANEIQYVKKDNSHEVQNLQTEHRALGRTQRNEQDLLEASSQPQGNATAQTDTEKAIGVTEAIDCVKRLRDEWAHYCSLSSISAEMDKWGHRRDAADEIITALSSLESKPVVSERWASVKSTCRFCGRNIEHICTAFLKDDAATTPASVEAPTINSVIHREWDTPEEDEAWKDLNSVEAPVGTEEKVIDSGVMEWEFDSPPEQQSPRVCPHLHQDFPGTAINRCLDCGVPLGMSFKSPRVCGDCGHSNLDSERGYCIQQMPNYIGRALCGHKCIFSES